MARRQSGFLISATMFLLAGCATPSSQIAAGLSGQGMDATRAACIGQDLASHLTIAQLQELGRAARAFGTGDGDPSRLTSGDLVRVAGQIRDPAVPIAVAGAGLRCGALSGR